MSNSLREQLLKQGLVSKDQAKQAEKQAKLKAHQVQKTQSKKQRGNVVDKESASYLAAKAREEEIARAKELNRHKEVEREKKALLSQVFDIINFNLKI